MSLYRWELQKIWKRRSARVALALMLVWTMAGILVNAFYNNSHKEDGVTPCVPGPQEITNQLAWAEPWRGELTGAQLAAAQTTVYDLYRDPANRGPDGEVTNEAWNAVIRPLGSMTNTLMNIAAGVYSLPYAAWGELEPDRLLTYYDDRADAVDRWLQSQFKDPADRAVFEAQEARVQTPFVYDWYSGQVSVLQIIQDTMLGVCLLLGVALAPLFCGEVQSGVLAVSHCTRQGRGRLAAAKVGAALTVAVGAWAVSSALLVASQLYFFGTRGLECPIQLLKPLATAPLTFGDCEVYALVFGLACCLGTVGITAGLSGAASASFPVMAGVFGLLVLLPMFGGMLPWAVQQAVALLPSAGDYYDLFRQNLYHIGPLRVWSPVMQLAVQPLYLAVLAPLAWRVYTRRQVR